MKVHLKERLLGTGRTSLYLEFYNGYSKDADGKIKHNRTFETLDYYLINNPKTPREKQHNKDHKAGAEAVKATRILEIQNGVYGLANTHLQNGNFIAYVTNMANAKTDSSGNHGNWLSMLKHLKAYAGESVAFKFIDEKFVEGFKEYLVKTARTSADKNLSTNTALSYLTKLRAALGEAHNSRIIQFNPAKSVKGIKPAETERQYLTAEEVAKLINTECRYEILKRAFLFSCFSGMRWSDLISLTWKQVTQDGNDTRIMFTQTKTKGVEYLDIPVIAQRYLGDRAANLDEKVFSGLKYSSYTNAALTNWMSKAKIDKHITFHCARHTYATMLLTQTDIYTVSKLLGHRELKTTQVYAKVMDHSKKQAVNALDNLFKS